MFIPTVYDGDLDYPNKPDNWDEERDQYEETVYKYAKVNKIPILAICRGLQLVNVLEGGTMLQDLGDEGNETHRKIEVDKEHTVTIDLGQTMLGDITGAMSGTVNSAHHQAVDEPGRSLMVNATSERQRHRRTRIQRQDQQRLHDCRAVASRKNERQRNERVFKKV